MSTLTIPNPITNGTLADGAAVNSNFQAIKTWADAAVVETATFAAARTMATFTRTSNTVATDTSDVSNDPPTTVLFEAEADDNDGLWSSGGTLTLPVAGFYLFGTKATLVSIAGDLSSWILNTVASTGRLVASTSPTFSVGSTPGAVSYGGVLLYTPSAGTTVTFQAQANKAVSGANVTVTVAPIIVQVQRLTQ